MKIIPALILELMVMLMPSCGFGNLDVESNPFGFNLEKAGIRGDETGNYAVVGYNYSFWTTNATSPGTGPCCYLTTGQSLRCIKD